MIGLSAGRSSIEEVTDDVRLGGLGDDVLDVGRRGVRGPHSTVDVPAVQLTVAEFICLPKAALTEGSAGVDDSGMVASG